MKFAILMVVFLLRMSPTRQLAAILMSRFNSFNIKSRISQRYMHNQKGQGQQVQLQVHDELEQKIYNNLINECKFKVNLEIPSYLLLCVSGGVDSMALLHIFKNIKHKYIPNLNINVINFNHQQREQAKEEEKFVKYWSNQYNFTYYSHDNYFPLLYDKNFQNNARKWRQNECIKILQELPASCYADQAIVTAHHSDDQVETFLLKLLRGAYISNLHAMLPRTKCNNYIKPLLKNVTKNMLIEYMRAHEYTWYEDSSNQEKVYKRNIVRLDLIPLLQQLTGGDNALRLRVNNIIEQSSLLNEYLTTSRDYSDAYKDENTLDISENSHYSKLHLFAQYDLIYELVSRYENSVTYENIKKIVAFINSNNNSTGKKVIKVSKDFHVVKMGKVVKFIEQVDGDDEICTSAVGDTMFTHNKHVTVTTKTSDPESHFKVTMYNIDGSNKQFLVRPPMDGDRFQPPWKSSPIKVTDYLRSQKVSFDSREDIPVVVNVATNTVVAVGSVTCKEYNSKSENVGKQGSYDLTIFIGMT